MTADAITARLDDREWEVVTAGEQVRSLGGHRELQDVVVRARRTAYREVSL